MNKRDKIILFKIVDEAAVLAQLLDSIDESAFLANEEKMRAACMTLINIGELVKNLNSEFRESNQQIKWKAIAGFRDVAAHGYFTLKMDDVFMFATTKLPEIIIQIKEILDCEEIL